MRAKLVLLGILLGLVVGCEPSIGPTFRTAFPAYDGTPDGTVDLAELPVVVYDFTFRIASVEIVEPPVGGDYRLGRLVQVDGDPAAVRLDWLSGACESRVSVLFVRADAGYRLAMQSHAQLVMGCPALGIGRSMIVRFKEPTAPAEIRFWSPLDVQLGEGGS